MKRTKQEVKTKQLKLMELRVAPGFDPNAVIEKLIRDNPDATQEDIYRLAFQDRGFVGAVATMAVSDALLAYHAKKGSTEKPV